MAVMEEPSDDLPECDSCGYETRELTEYRRDYGAMKGSGEGGAARLCFLCANTRGGNVQAYPEQYPNQQAVLQTICYVGNVILAELRKAKS